MPDLFQLPPIQKKRLPHGMASGHEHNAGGNIWLTPPNIIKELGPFDLDPCAAADPRPWPTATKHIAPPDNGLRHTWHGRVWLNPPYDQHAWRWLARLAEHGTGTALIFARTETAGFHAHVWKSATGLFFPLGRLTFFTKHGTKAKGNAGAPSVFVAYSANDADRLMRSNIRGHFVGLKN